MKLIKITFLFLFSISLAAAVDIESKPLSELVGMADHIIVGHVVNVDMVDTNDNIVTDDHAMTGPGGGNTIRLHVDVISLLKTNKPASPKRITIKLWRIWQYSLGQVREASLNKKEIFLLKGPEFNPVYPGLFRRGIEEQHKINTLLLR